jgi:hypothetical protein
VLCKCEENTAARRDGIPRPEESAPMRLKVDR